MCNGLQGLKWVQTCIAWDCEVWCVVLGLKLMKMCNKSNTYILFACLCVCFIDRSLSFFFWPLCCLFFFDLRILITPLVSSNSSLNSNHILSSTKGSNKCSQFRNFVYKLTTLYSCLLPLSEKNNLILYSIFDHLTFGGWDIFLFVKKSLEFNRLETLSRNERGRVWRFKIWFNPPFL